MDQSTPKTCVRCGETKARSEFHKRPVAYDGLNAACKTCICAEQRKRRATNPDRARAADRRYREANSEQAAERTRRWRERNPDKRREYAKRYDEENAELVAARKRAYYEANKERLKALRDPERSREIDRRYRERNRELRAERQRQRRVDKLGLRVEDVDLEALWTGNCGICSEPMDRSLKWPDRMSPSIDHILPLAKGGTHAQENLQWAHLTCNVRKGARVDDLERR